MMGLEKELKDAAASLQRCNPTAISLKAGCELFLRWVAYGGSCLPSERAGRHSTVSALCNLGWAASRRTSRCLHRQRAALDKCTIRSRR